MICRRRGVKKACQGESEKPAGLFAAQETPAQLFFLCSFSGRSRSMFTLSLFKSGCTVAAVARAHSEENPYPDIGQGTHGNGVAFALLSLALVVVSGPTCSLSTLPCELLECIAQRFATRIAPMRLGIVPTLKQDRRGPSQGLQTGSLSIAVRIIPNFSQQPRGKPFSSSGQAAKHLAVSMGQKKLLDYLVIVSNLLNQRLQLLEEHQHQASFRSYGDGISSQLWLVQGLQDLWGNLSRCGMTSLLEDLSNLSD